MTSSAPGMGGRISLRRATLSGRYANGAVGGAGSAAAGGQPYDAANDGSPGQSDPNLDDRVTRNPLVAERARYVMSNGIKVLDLGTYTVSHDPSIPSETAQSYGDAAEDGWTSSATNARGESIGATVKLELAGTAASLRRSSADIHIQPCPSTGCTGAGLGNAARGGRFIIYSPAQRSDTPVHEFGHIFGLGHQAVDRTPGAPNSIMGAASNRSVLYSDIERLSGAYGRW